MKPNISHHQSMRRVRSTTAAAFAIAMTAALSAHAGVTPPRVPPDLEVPAGNTAFLKGSATGTQNYVCLPATAGFEWSLFTPQATLFNAHSNQITTHFFSPNPAEKGEPVRAAWQHSRDTSTVWAKLVRPSSDSAFVAPGSIPWLLLEVVGTAEGPTGGDTLSPTTFIQRVKTAGGVAPSTGCAAAADVGKRAFVPYKADYFFYEKSGYDY
jgi:hypothetical protein